MKRSDCTESRGRQLRPLKTLVVAAMLGLGAAQAQADTLWEIYLQALDNDQQLAADRAAYHAGLEAKNLGRSALLPQINAYGEVARSEVDVSRVQTQGAGAGGEAELVSFPLTSNTTTDDRVYAASLTQALFDAPAWFGYKQGKSASEQAAAEFSANQQEMMLRVATAYFDVLRAYDVLEAARAEEEALAKQLEQTQQRFEVGLTAITDVYDSQAAFDSAVARRLTAQDDLLSNFDALSVLTGTHHDTVAPLVDTFNVAPPEPADRSAWVDFALANNFDLKAARLAADAARFGARAAASEHLPTLTGSLNYRKDYSDGDTTATAFGDTDKFPVDDEIETRIAAIRLDVPIFTGGRLSASRREARNLAFQSEDLRNLTERNTVQNTRTLHRAVVTDVSRVRAREQAVISAKSALDATQAGYEVGTRNIVDVLLAQRTLFQNQTDYANALYDYILNTLSLKRVAGLLAPNDLQQLETRLNPAQPVSRVAEAGAPTLSK
ncbi:TolC family outer membrane protein [Microbulbifer magnicolonia]|uniref:TolC family outer membrane protein n=1 Tax=Microbulbifer magnicolonia TaxID=3109744 RepID=UPI002B40332D|nr:TolC family outer membrane protein [Microbulbifer sp. GG15]